NWLRRQMSSQFSMEMKMRSVMGAGTLGALLFAGEDDAAASQEFVAAAAEQAAEEVEGQHSGLADQAAEDGGGGEEMGVEAALMLDVEADVLEHVAQGAGAEEANVGIAPGVAAGGLGAAAGVEMA